MVYVWCTVFFLEYNLIHSGPCSYTPDMCQVYLLSTLQLLSIYYCNLQLNFYIIDKKLYIIFFLFSEYKIRFFEKIRVSDPIRPILTDSPDSDSDSILIFKTMNWTKE